MAEGLHSVTQGGVSRIFAIVPLESRMKSEPQTAPSAPAAEGPSSTALGLGTLLGATIVAVFVGACWVDSKTPAPVLPPRPRYVYSRLPIPT